MTETPKPEWGTLWWRGLEYRTLRVQPVSPNVARVAQYLFKLRHPSGDPERPELMTAWNAYQPAWWFYRTSAQEIIDLIKDDENA